MAASREARLQLYTYYRSQASFRVRIALNLKGLAHDDTFLHLEKGDQFASGIQGAEPADGGADADRRRCEALPIAGDPRIPRREIPGAAAVAGRCRGARLGAGIGIDQHRRLPSAD